jgi:hypothetical protein
MSFVLVDLMLYDGRCATLCQCHSMSEASSVLLTLMEIIYWRILEISLYVSSNISSLWVQSLTGDCGQGVVLTVLDYRPAFGFELRVMVLADECRLQACVGATLIVLHQTFHIVWVSYLVSNRERTPYIENGFREKQRTFSKWQELTGSWRQVYSGL